MSRPGRWHLLTLTVAVVAFTVRLVPVLRGGGLYGLGDYDDGVYYSSAVGLAHGLLPYRDFLLLHPPGIVLLLSPFAALGRFVGDPTGFAVARVAWMALGGLNAALVSRILRPQGLFAAFLGGFFYALFMPAVYGEHTTQLEGVATTCLLVAVLLLSAPPGRSWPWVALAGAALGLSTSIKIWGGAEVLIAAGWLLVGAGWKRAGVLLLGATAGATVVCLPFFLAAPATIFRMVVLDQLGRPSGGTPVATRLAEICGLWPTNQTANPALLVVVLATFVVVVVFAALRPPGRLPAALLCGLTLMLLITPVWFLHYASLIAGPAAVTVGLGSAQLFRWLRQRRPRAALAVGAALTALVTSCVAPIGPLQFGHPFPGPSLGAAVMATPGCVTTDDPTALIEMNVLSRNIDRGCALVVDLGGHSYDAQAVPGVTRLHNDVWQHFALTYLRQGTIVVLIRFSTGKGFSAATSAAVRQWPVVRTIGRFVLRRASMGHE